MNAPGHFDWVDPRTWPWFFYVWLGLTALGFLKKPWDKLQRRRKESWPITTGQIDSATISSVTRRNSESFEVKLEYSYQPAGDIERGVYKRKFHSVEEAAGFGRELDRKPVVVHYNPNKPSSSMLSESSVESLLHV
ncbi:MAG TPA: DUF3592 domain-containing protein [Verrucomicrobiae bacterium]|nr:DUF3592 domain-containing protein [Verrucomicrobiae bacterium]